MIDAQPAAGGRLVTNRVKSVGRSPWLGFFARRLVSLVCILAVLVLVVFFMVRLVPGNPIIDAFGGSIPKSEVNRLMHEYGLDQPALDQLGTYVSNLLHGNLGASFQTQQPVTQIISQRLGSSIQLAAAALVIVLFGGVSVGMGAAALTRNGKRPRTEAAFTGLTSASAAIPDFVWGTLLVFLFAVTLHLLPASGSGSFSELVLPALALALPLTAYVARIVRVETLNVLAQDYTRTARSDRIPTWRIYLRHALPNVLTATLTLSGLIFAGLIGGAVVVEQVFARAGVGSALVTAILANDYPTVQGITLVLGLAVVVINTVVDVILALLDPQSLTRHQ